MYIHYIMGKPLDNIVISDCIFINLSSAKKTRNQPRFFANDSDYSYLMPN